MNNGDSIKEKIERAKETKAVRLVGGLKSAYKSDSGNNLAAAITFFGFLSLFPLILLGLSVTGFVLAEDAELRMRLIGRLANAVPGMARFIGDNVEALTEGRTGAGILGVLGIVWAGIKVVEASENAISRIYDRWEPTPFLKQKLRALGHMVLLGSMTLAGASLAALAGSMKSYMGWSGTGETILAIAVGGLAFLVDLAIFLVAYRILYRGPGPSVSDLWPGALLAASGWLILKLAGSWYAARTVSSASEIYGTFASVVGLLLLMFLAARLFVYGAELNAVLTQNPLLVHGEPVSEDRSAGRRRVMEIDLTEREGNGSTAGLMRSIAEDASLLVRKEIELAKVELTTMFTSKLLAVAAMTAAGIVALFVVLFLGLAVASALDQVMAPWLSRAIVAVGFLLISVAAVLIGKSKLSEHNAPELTRESLRKDIDLAKNHLPGK